jgi:Flp pilus assembly protein TadG
MTHSQSRDILYLTPREDNMQRKQQRPRIRSRRDRGFVLVTVALAAVAVFGCLGLAVDLGRMYIVKNEAQSYADAAALAGALQLNGTSAGVTAAQTAATSLGDYYNLGTTSFTGTTVQVATSLSGPWVSTGSPPSPATNYIYAKVTANASMKLYFLPVVSGSTSLTVQAAATAQQVAPSTWNTGAFPFSPIGFDGPNGGNNTAATNWGFVVGQQYTMRYAANGKSECTGDSGDSDHTKNGSARGFWGDNSANVLGQQVLGDLQEESLTVGEVLPGVGGAKTSVADDIVSRVDQDTDTSDDTYASYIAGGGNGRRLVTMPIQSEVDGTVLGFGTFLLMDDGSYDHTGNSNWCAIFIGGAGLRDSPGGLGASSTFGTYVVQLVQ